MFADECAAAILLWEIIASVEGEAKRCDLRTQRIVGHDSLRNRVRTLWMHTNVNMAAVIASGPPIETAVFHERHVIRHQIVTEFIALVDDPQRTYVVGSNVKPFGLRSPLANSRMAPLFGSTS
ncbi:MAG: hypothetical protein JWM36_1193 [Hyphomicrobiales bacterium]|nr:hypothetical protein [Hyphomicrobiales bacterium]